jgi:hypothetical protein
MADMDAVDMGAFLAPLKNLQIHALKFLFGNRENVKLETCKFKLKFPMQGI